MADYGSVKTEGNKRDSVVASPLKNELVEAINIKQAQPFEFWGVIANNGSGFAYELANGKRFRITVRNSGILKTGEVV